MVNNDIYSFSDINSFLLSSTNNLCSFAYVKSRNSGRQSEPYNRIAIFNRLPVSAGSVRSSNETQVDGSLGQRSRILDESEPVG